MTVGVALIGSELEEAQSLAVVLGETTAVISIENAKIVLCCGVALIRGEPVKARSLLAGVLGKGLRDRFRRNSQDWLLRRRAPGRRLA